MSKNHWAEPKELHIPVSFGHIAAKVWGSENSEPVLALHGWQDNAGTFDRLIPLLSSKLNIVAIDAPGHGFSSHKPVGAFYHLMEMLLDIKRVVTYLKWEKFSFIGHSMGGRVALMYASVFPEEVKNLILLDVVIVNSVETGKLPDVTHKRINYLLKIEQKMSGTLPVYSFEEAKLRLMEGIFDKITPESADILLKRGCKPSSCGKGVVYSRDFRLKANELQKLSHDDLKAFMQRIKCNMLIILGNESVIYKYHVPEVLSDLLSIYNDNCKSFKIVKVDGNHFVHLNNPINVATHIDEFFCQHLKLSKL